MLKIDEVIVVEGKYDRIKLAQFIDATVIETSGFRIFNEPGLRALLTETAEKRGLIVSESMKNTFSGIGGFFSSLIGIVSNSWTISRHIFLNWLWLTLPP